MPVARKIPIDIKIWFKDDHIAIEDPETGEMSSITEFSEFYAKYKYIGEDDDGQEYAQRHPSLCEYWTYHGAPDWLMPRWVEFQEWAGNDNALVVSGSDGNKQRAYPGDHVIIRKPNGVFEVMDISIFLYHYKTCFWRSALAFVQDKIAILLRDMLGLLY